MDGASWGGDGLARLREMAEAMDRLRLTVFDFALVRQSRWREAIASIFDTPECVPYIRAVRRISVTYATHDPTGAPGSTNVVKPLVPCCTAESCTTRAMGSTPTWVARVRARPCMKVPATFNLRIARPRAMWPLSGITTE